MFASRISAGVRSTLFVIVCVTWALAQTSSVPSGHASPQNSLHAKRSQYASQYTRMATAIGDDYFDGKDSLERVRRHMRVARAVGVRYLRCAFSWNGIEPERGQYRFDFWDMLVNEAGRAGIELIPYVAYTPKWAAVSQTNFWEQPPADPADYARFMQTLAKRFRGKIRHWELWNEPDNREYWQGSPEQFAKTIIAAAQAIRKVAPEDALVLGGMSREPSDFSQTVISKYHLDQYLGVLAMHAYPETWDEERAETTFGKWIEQMHAAARRSGRKLWLDEMGYADYRYRPDKASVYGINVNYSYEHTTRYAADFLFKSFVMTLGSGDVSLAGWYRIDDFRDGDPRMPQDKTNDHLGIIGVDGKPKPEYFALRFFNSLFSKPTRRVEEPPATPGSQAIVEVFQRKDGEVIVAGWLRSSNYSEVAVHSGMLTDPRRERVDIALPCTAARVSTYNALGIKLSTGYRRSRELSGVPLTGDHVYVADVRCAAGRRK
jgi:Cellulase (glycosyl hydrolase family 5)